MAGSIEELLYSRLLLLDEPECRLLVGDQDIDELA